MYIFTLYSANGKQVGQTPLPGQAIRAAQNYSAAHASPCIVECRKLDTNEARRVQFNADGTMIKLWQAA